MDILVSFSNYNTLICSTIIKLTYNNVKAIDKMTIRCIYNANNGGKNEKAALNQRSRSISRCQ